MPWALEACGKGKVPRFPGGSLFNQPFFWPSKSWVARCGNATEGALQLFFSAIHQRWKAKQIQKEYWDFQRMSQFQGNSRLEMILVILLVPLLNFHSCCSRVAAGRQSEIR